MAKTNFEVSYDLEIWTLIKINWIEKNTINWLSRTIGFFAKFFYSFLCNFSGLKGYSFITIRISMNLFWYLPIWLLKIKQNVPKRYFLRSFCIPFRNCDWMSYVFTFHFPQVWTRLENYENYQNSLLQVRLTHETEGGVLGEEYLGVEFHLMVIFSEQFLILF